MPVASEYTAQERAFWMWSELSRRQAILKINSLSQNFWKNRAILALSDTNTSPCLYNYLTLYQANWWYKSSFPHLSSHGCLWFVLPYHYYGLNACCSNHSSLDGKHVTLHARRGMISWERLWDQHSEEDLLLCTQLPYCRQPRTFCFQSFCCCCYLQYAQPFIFVFPVTAVYIVLCRFTMPFPDDV